MSFIKLNSLIQSKPLEVIMKMINNQTEKQPKNIVPYYVFQKWPQLYFQFFSLCLTERQGLFLLFLQLDGTLCLPINRRYLADARSHSLACSPLYFSLSLSFSPSPEPSPTPSSFFFPQSPPYFLVCCPLESNHLAVRGP